MKYKLNLFIFLLSMSSYGSIVLNDSIINRVKAFVQDYGKSNNYNFILGSNEAGSVLYGEEASDLTQEILKALNENYSLEN